MTVYVDSAQYLRGKTICLFCHMIVDSNEELHVFAESIGIKRCWYHSSARYQHYDLNETQRRSAINAGAIEGSAKQLVTLSKK